MEKLKGWKTFLVTSMVILAGVMDAIPAEMATSQLAIVLGIIFAALRAVTSSPIFKVEGGKSLIGVGLLALCIGAGSSGCSLNLDFENNAYGFSLFKLDPGDEVQNAQNSTLGAVVEPTGPGGPNVKLGLVTSKQSRVPGFDPGTYVPNVVMETLIDQDTGAALGDSVIVNGLE